MLMGLARSGLFYGNLPASYLNILFRSLCGHEDNFKTSLFGMPVEFPTSALCNLSLDFERGPLSSIGGFPDCDEALLSTWPSNSILPKPVLDIYPIDESEIPGLHWVEQGLGFAPFPSRDFKRNNMDSLRRFTSAHLAGSKNKSSSGLNENTETLNCC
jgi:hypothetical protein